MRGKERLKNAKRLDVLLLPDAAGDGHVGDALRRRSRGDGPSLHSHGWAFLGRGYDTEEPAPAQGVVRCSAEAVRGVVERMWYGEGWGWVRQGVLENPGCHWPFIHTY